MEDSNQLNPESTSSTEEKPAASNLVSSNIPNIFSSGLILVGAVVIAVCVLVSFNNDVRVSIFGTDVIEMVHVKRCSDNKVDSTDLTDFGSVDEEVDMDNEDTNTENQSPTDPVDEGTTISYENDHISIDIFSGWDVGEADNHAVNITKDNYILYVAPNASQASGVMGGRFSEIAMGATGVDLVMLMHPAEPCGEMDVVSLTGPLERTDISIAQGDGSNPDVCVFPSEPVSVWYFSYVVTEGDGYFGDVSSLNPDVTDSLRQFVITMTYDTDDIDDLPLGDSVELEQMIEEMTEMVESMELKQ